MCRFRCGSKGSKMAESAQKKKCIASRGARTGVLHAWRGGSAAGRWRRLGRSFLVFVSATRRAPAPQPRARRSGSRGRLRSVGGLLRGGHGCAAAAARESLSRDITASHAPRITHRVYSMFSSMLHRNSTGSCDTNAARMQAQTLDGTSALANGRTDGSVQPCRRRVPRVDAVERHASEVRRVERLQQVEQRGLAGAGGPHQRERAPRRRAQAHAAQHLRRRPRRVRKVHLRA